MHMPTDSAGAVSGPPPEGSRQRGAAQRVSFSKTAAQSTTAARGPTDTQFRFQKRKKSKSRELQELAEFAVPIISTEYVKAPPSSRDKSTMVYIWGERVFSPESDIASSAIDSVSLHVPMILDQLPAVPVASVALGATHALLLSDAGVLYAFGMGAHGQLGLGPRVRFTTWPRVVERTDLEGNVAAISCGEHHSVCLSKDGQVFCWGIADCVGNARRVDCRVPKPVQYLRWVDGAAAPVATPWPCTAIAARFGQTIAVNANRELFTWGHAFSCRYHMTPCRTFTFPNKNNKLQPTGDIAKIELGRHFALALTDSGTIFAWGDGTYGEVGQLNCENDWLTAASGGPDVPSILPLIDAHGNDLKTVTDIAVGARHALLLSKEGRVWAYGENFAGQCGAPLSVPRIASPTLVRTVGAGHQIKASAVFAGHRHSACLADGALFLWGHSSHHKLVHTASAASLIRSSDNRASDGGPPMGVAVRSGLKESVVQPRLVYSLLQANVTRVALGENVSLIVTGTGIVPGTAPVRKEVPQLSPLAARDDFENQVQSYIGFRPNVDPRRTAGMRNGTDNAAQREHVASERHFNNGESPNTQNVDGNTGTDNRNQPLERDGYEVYELRDDMTGHVSVPAPVQTHDNLRRRHNRSSERSLQEISEIVDWASAGGTAAHSSHRSDTQQHTDNNVNVSASSDTGSSSSDEGDDSLGSDSSGMEELQR